MFENQADQRDSGLRLRSVDVCKAPSPFDRVRELHLEDCLLDSDSVACVLDSGNHFTNLRELRLAGNALQSLQIPKDIELSNLEHVEIVGLERNNFEDLDCLQGISNFFPSVTTLSLKDNKISRISQSSSVTRNTFPHIRALNLSDNKIASYQFFNGIPELLPNLTSLQVTNNPLYQQDAALITDGSRALDKSFYLTLARIPTLETLNYTNISARDRQEGGLYYLSVVEKDLRDLLANGTKPEDLKDRIVELHPSYPALVRHHERDSILDTLNSDANSANGFPVPTKPTYAGGSLGARLVTATFYLPQLPSDPNPLKTVEPVEVALTIPTTLPVKQLMSLLHRHPTFRPHLRPLQFNLIFESTEFDPVDTTTESTTRSAMYGMTPEQKRNLWREWGNWDADAVVERALRQVENEGMDQKVMEEGNGEQWTQDGEFQIRDGRKWKRREVNIPHSLKRGWGDWIDEKGEVIIRIETSVQR